MPRLIEFYEKNKQRRERFEILSFHMHGKVSTLAELDEKLKPIIEKTWLGKPLPFPILMDATRTTEETYRITQFPTALLITPDGILAKVMGDPLKVLENELK